MFERMAKKIRENFINKTDDELLQIWTDNDRENWSESAFEAIRQILVERNIKVPLQNIKKVESKSNAIYDKEPKSVDVSNQISQEPSTSKIAEIPTLKECEERYGQNLSEHNIKLIQKWAAMSVSDSSLFTYPDIPKERLYGAFDTYSIDTEDSVILALLDKTVFGSGRIGLLLSTEGIFWKSNSPTLSLKFEEIDPRYVEYHKGNITINQIHTISLGSAFAKPIPSICSFIQEAARLKAKPPKECWEFASSISDNKPNNYYKFLSKEEIKQAFDSYRIRTYYLYRNYYQKIVMTEAEKGEWKSIPDSLYYELGLSKNELIIIEKKTKMQLSIGLAIFAAIALIMILFFSWLAPHVGLTGGEMGIIVFSIVGTIVGSIVLYMKHPVLGLFGLIVGLIYTIKTILNIRT